MNAFGATNDDDWSFSLQPVAARCASHHYGNHIALYMHAHARSRCVVRVMIQHTASAAFLCYSNSASGSEFRNLSEDFSHRGY